MAKIYILFFNSVLIFYNTKLIIDGKYSSETGSNISMTYK